MKKNPRLETRRKKIDPANRRAVEHSIAIAKQIGLLMKEKGVNQKRLAELMEKSESEISKWMSGTHNFTTDTIAKIETALGGRIIICPKDILPIEYRIYFSQEQATVAIKKRKSKTVLAPQDIVMNYSVSSQEPLSNCIQHLN